MRLHCDQLIPIPIPTWQSCFNTCAFQWNDVFLQILSHNNSIVCFVSLQFTNDCNICSVLPLLSLKCFSVIQTLASIILPNQIQAISNKIHGVMFKICGAIIYIIIISPRYCLTYHRCYTCLGFDWLTQILLVLCDTVVILQYPRLLYIELH